MTPEDIAITARTIYGEARGEPWAGKVAVAWVIRNRAENRAWWGDGYTSVCLKPWQFSCWNPDDPNRKKIKDVDVDNVTFRDCLAVTAGVVAGIIPDPTHGATHYYNPAVVTPQWASAGTETVTIGRHKFFKDVR